MIEKFSIDFGGLAVVAAGSRFTGADGVREYHFALQPTQYADAATQLLWLADAYRIALETFGLDANSSVFRRWHCSDIANQAALLKSQDISNRWNADEPCAVSWVGQPPVPPAKLALWAYHIHDPEDPLDKRMADCTLSLRRGALTHHWMTGLSAPGDASSDVQTRAVFERYGEWLVGRRLSLADHVLRTWLFVQDVDMNYGGLVTARRQFFAEHGLTRETHFIASTGVEGRSAETGAKVTMDAYAIQGVTREQIHQLSALEHLSPTHVYGVTFERGTAISYGDRTQILLSGTASIDDRGNIVYPGDVRRQLDRTIENMEALLQHGGASLQDLAAMTVYVRDAADMDSARRWMHAAFGDVPTIVTCAPVCRPGWLIEVEGIAVMRVSHAHLPSF